MGKMGLERGLMEKIPEICAVEQVSPDGGPELSEEGIQSVLDEVRPFLKMAGGDVEMISCNATGVMPSVALRMTGSGRTINSVKAEIASRLRRNFSTLGHVQFND